MTGSDETGTDETGIDGRSARRERNINAVLDVVVEMFGERAMFPSMEQAAQRSGLSLRSLYRYFTSPADLLEAAITRSREVSRSLAHLPAIGQGPLDRRITDFVDMRLRLATELASVQRATAANAALHPRIEAERRASLDALHDQFLAQFAPELAGLTPSRRRQVSTIGDLTTQLDAIRYLLDYRALLPAQARSHLVAALHELLD